MSLSGKKILIGISAGIAAYKIPYLIRLLKKAGVEVQVVITPTAKDFVTPLTLSTLSENPVLGEPFDAKSGSWNSHVDLALWADLIVIAPATANTMAKMVTGITDNLLTAVCLSARSQIMIAPTMDLDMYKNAVTQRNIKALTDLGHIILEPNTGELASGLRGEGRMQEPEQLFDAIESFFKKKTPLTGKTVLVSAGPTYESIDPVRFIGNHSTGLMGVKIAETAAEAGANVILVSGPGVARVENKNIEQINITSAGEMFDVCMKHFPSCDIGIMAAAIADFTPKTKANQKIKKGNKPPVIELVPTEDVLLNMGRIKKENQILVGFALETDNEVDNAISKLERKNLDFIVLNSLRDNGAGFGHQTNKVVFIDRDKTQKDFPLKSKAEVAEDIISHITEIIDKQ
jgi:phosphopantothenoylcysteine decarboxylase/phosphopantothenate--cysteine ligase